MELESSRTFDSEKNLNSAPVLVMTVDIGEGIKDNLVVYQESSIETVVEDFKNKHNLTAEQENTLLEMIRESLHDENCEPTALTKSEYLKQFDQQIEKLIQRPPNHQPKINKNSVRIMRQKQVLPVFERLYSLSAKHQTDPEIKANPKGKQCGNRLYNNWIAKKQHLDKERSRVIDQQEQEFRSFSFKPKINQNIQVSSRVQQNSLILQRAHEENLEQKRFDQLAKEQEDCTFVPQINPVSDNILQQRLRIRSKNKFEELYEEASIRKEKNEELAQQ